MNLELVRTFLEVDRLRHFGRAAEELHLTQAAVSARIRQLEEIFGTQLFDRATRDIQLTPAGHRLLRHAEALMADWRNARQDVALGDASQQLAFGGSLRLWSALLQGWLHRLRHSAPDLAIIAEMQEGNALNRRLLDGLIDFAVMLEPAQLQALQIRPITDVELVLVSTRPGLSAAVALGDQYVDVDWCLAHGVEHRRRFPDAPEARTRVSQANMALLLIQELGGSAYLPMEMVRPDIEAGTLHQVEDAPSFSRTAFAVYPVRTARLEIIDKCLTLFEAEASSASEKSG